MSTDQCASPDPGEAEGELRALEQRLQASDLALARALEELRESGELLTHVMAAVPCGIVLTDRTGRVCSVNAATKAMSGLEAAELLGHDLAGLLAEGPVGGGLAPGANGELIGRGGARSPVRLSRSALRDGSGAFVGELVVALDLGEERRRLEALRSDRELEPLARLVERLARELGAELDRAGKGAEQVEAALGPSAAGDPALAEARDSARRARLGIERATDVARTLERLARDGGPLAQGIGGAA